MVANISLENDAMKDLIQKKVLTPALKRNCVAHLAQVGMSKRQACRILDLARSTYRYTSTKAADPVLAERIKAIACDRPRFGYKRNCLLIRAEGTKVNHKRVYRIYRDLNLAVRKRGRRKYHWGRRTPKETPLAPNDRWSMDLTSDTLSDGRRFRTLNIISKTPF
jgi:putative transposase